MFGKLHLIGSPIGNMSDVSERLLNAFKEAKYICVEDIDRFKEYCTRNKFFYTAELIDICFSLNNNREKDNKERIMSLLKNGEDVYIISDEGMPGLADPGDILVREAIKNNIDLVTSPGPSTAIAAASIANILNNFTFEGFMPDKDEDRHFKFKILQQSIAPMIFLLHNPNNRPVDKEDKIHMLHTCFDYDVFIKECINFFGEERNAIFCIDLTTEKQKIIRGKLKELEMYFMENKVFGNICLVVDGILNKAITI